MLRVWQKLDRYASDDLQGGIFGSLVNREHNLGEGVSLWLKRVGTRAVPGHE